MIAVVHLVTLWITASILGAVYMIGPMALRMPMPARAADRWAFGLFVAGVSGMVIHFWIAEPSGMAWGAGMVTLAVSRVALRVLRALPAAPIRPAVKLHFALGFVNLLLAAAVVLDGIGGVWVVLQPRPLRLPRREGPRFYRSPCGGGEG